jgi:hypothetical protein
MPGLNRGTGGEIVLKFMSNISHRWFKSLDMALYFAMYENISTYTFSSPAKC